MSQQERSENDSQGNFLDRMAQRLGGSAHAGTIFGTPVERGDVTVIPVAQAAYAFGGGSGTKNGEEGSGGGGGVRVSPMGYIEIRNGGTVYKPIRDWAVLIPAIAAGGLLTLLCARGIVRLIHR
jgi:uncharacterized spore protein YtfJ